MVVYIYAGERVPIETIAENTRTVASDSRHILNEACRSWFTSLAKLGRLVCRVSLEKVVGDKTLVSLLLVEGFVFSTSLLFPRQVASIT